MTKIIFIFLELKKNWLEGKSCPGGDTPCNENGQCDTSTGICTCNVGIKGLDCSGISY